MGRNCKGGKRARNIALEDDFSRKHEDKRVEVIISGTLITAKKLVIFKSEPKCRVSLLVGLMYSFYCFLCFSFLKCPIMELIVMAMNSHFNVCHRKSLFLL